MSAPEAAPTGDASQSAAGSHTGTAPAGQSSPHPPGSDRHRTILPANTGPGCKRTDTPQEEPPADWEGGAASKREHQRLLFGAGSGQGALGICTELDEHEKVLRVFPVRGRDLSRSGMGLLSPSMIHTNRRLLLKFPTAARGGGESTTLLFGVVRYSRYCPGKGYVVGVRLQTMPTTPAFKELVTAARAA
jgi:hypothetical protein